MHIGVINDDTRLLAGGILRLGLRDGAGCAPAGKLHARSIPGSAARAGNAQRAADQRVSAA